MTVRVVMSSYIAVTQGGPLLTFFAVACKVIKMAVG